MAIQPVVITILLCSSGSWVLSDTDLKPKFTYTKTKQTDGILLDAVNIAICCVEKVNTTLRTRKIYNLLKSNRSKLILFNTSDSRYLYYVKYSHNF